VNPRARSSYGVVVTDTNRCTYRGSADVDVLSPPSPVVTAPPWATVGEKGLPASIPFHAGSQYSWAIQNGTVTSGLGTNAIVFTAGEQGTLWLASTETNAAACSAAPAYASVLVTSAPMALQTVTPCRLLDTRNGSDGPRFRGGETRLVPVPGRCGIPAIARALVLNVTAVQADLGGSVVVVPGDAPSAAVNTVSFGQGQTRASMAIVSLAVDGSETIAIWNTSPGGVDVLLDVSGWFE
jgi:hypothetical protein